MKEKKDNNNIEMVGMSEGERERLDRIADELERLEYEAHEGKKISYVDWIVQDLRRGNLETARYNYEQQSDKYGSWPEIEKFLKENGIAGKIIDLEKLQEEEEE